MKNPVELLQFSYASKRLPIILQTELAECGAACLAMVTSYYGHKMGIEAIRYYLPSSLKGLSLKNMIQAAGKVHLTPRALRLELDQLCNLKCPAILHWNLDHFVVLESVRGKNVIIHDPGRGRRVLSLKEVSESFTGVALELTPTHEFEKKSDIRRVKISELLKSVTGLKRALFQILLLSLVLQVFVLVSPFFMQITVDHVIASSDEDLLLALALGFGMLALIQMAATALRSWVILYLNSTLDVQLLANTLRHLLRLPLDYFQKRHLGDIISRFGSLRSVISLFTQGLIASIVDGIMAVATLVMMFIYSPKLAFVVLVAVLIYILVRIVTFRLNEQYKQESIVLSAKENTNFMETIRAVQTIKLFSKESQRESMWLNQYAAALNAGIKLGKLGIIITAINQAVFPVAAILIVWLGAQEIMASVFSVGMLYAFFSYQGQFTGKISTLIDTLIEFKLAGVDLERVSDIVHAEPEHNIADLLGSRVELQGDIEIVDLSYRYSENEPYVFENLNFKITAGETVVIVGVSGCGKSTLLKVMLGLLNPVTGDIFYDGKNISQIDKTELRTQTAAVMQEDCLVAGSISENIAFSDPQMDLQRVQAVAQMAAIHDEITQMPMGYNSLVGDMGTTLSGGQKQRLFLARALYVNPKVLFLDEASSHLDSHTEKLINATIKAMPITRIIIAHRQETIDLADRVIDLSQQSDPPTPTSFTPQPNATW
ncbi:Bacteriocin/lantibiotic efflux ABC transporter, permease/ATP-binding protein [hydrothermal vent metagenome]|uniref:Bacteriocin/lantibiotic efflux ABC transporter, permease/ATP-binding protein n=1 Tax=hydrothermal vent metagenome TaxID=652676 RepID=A0A3B0Z620_9ZZZZ